MTPQSQLVVIGIDVGTSGVRAAAANVKGAVLAEAECPLKAVRPSGSLIHEQDPHEWWRAVCLSVQQTLAKLKLQNPGIEVCGIAVTSTSGTLVPVDKQGYPLRPAILYDDGRAAAIAQEINNSRKSGGIRLNASLSLAKAAWVRKEEPEVWNRVGYLLHPADWLTGQLSGQFGISDTSNVLKLGYEAETGNWNQAVWLAGISEDQLPKVVSPGSLLGLISERASADTGLPVGSKILAGATDGMAGLLASGANQFGHANTTLGTTLIWKVLSEHKPMMAGGVYCHLHPSGAWVPGAASNAGPGSLRREESSPSAPDMDRMAEARLPTDLVCYLLPGQGERFPFEDPRAETFFERDPHDWIESYAAQLQAIGFVERWGYDRLTACGVEVSGTIFSTGGAARSPSLSQLRAHILKRTVSRCKYAHAAFGACILAASGVYYMGDVRTAIQEMTTPVESYFPSRELVEKYDGIYDAFRQACSRRGYD